jgi:fumarylacetoacetate (FAA) hydrolase
MKLVCYDSGRGPRAGVVVAEHVLDVATLLGEAGGLRDVRALLELPGDPLTQLQSALGSARAESGVALGRVRLRPPILQPPTVRDFMVYEGHASAGGTRQLSDAWYRLPIFYFSNPLCIFGPEDAVPYPTASEQLDYELELAAVIGREGKNVAEADAFRTLPVSPSSTTGAAATCSETKCRRASDPPKGKTRQAHWARGS